MALAGVREVAQTAVQRTIPKLTLTARGRAKQTRVLIGEAKKAIGGVLKAAPKLGVAAGAIGLKGTAASLGGAALAGIAAFWITTQVLKALERRRLAPGEKAFEAAMAYRRARLEAAATQGAPLTAAQQVVLAGAFRAQLKALGFSTSELGSLPRGG